MRKTLLIGNAIVAVVVGAIVFVLAGSGVDGSTLGLSAFGLSFVLATVHGLRVVNGLLARLDGIEEAAFRAAMGESNVRLGNVEPPFDGLASRLDRLFERLDESEPVPGTSIAPEGEGP